MNSATIVLKPGRDKSVRNGNPWIYSGSVARIADLTGEGMPCRIVAADGTFLAGGYVNSASKIPCRVMTRDDAPVDDALIERRVTAAVTARLPILGDATNACRLVNTEGDFLPGLIVDRYADGLVVQFLTLGMERFRDVVLATLGTLMTPSFIVERSDSPSRRDENLPTVCRVIMGDPGGMVEIRENGLRFLVDVLNGQKTGFYLDQRDPRHMIRALSDGRRVLNLFSYTGGFSVAAAAGGAESVMSVDTSGPALTLAERAMTINGFAEVDASYIKADVFPFINRCEDTFDLVIVDPPAFASKKAQVEGAARGYKDINLKSLRVIAPGGIMATFSCSHHVTPTLFRQIVFGAAVDAGRRVQVIAQTGHGPDHPFDICHIEGEYLKGLILRVVE